MDFKRLASEISGFCFKAKYQFILVCLFSSTQIQLLSFKFRFYIIKRVVSTKRKQRECYTQNHLKRSQIDISYLFNYHLKSNFISFSFMTKFKIFWNKVKIDGKCSKIKVNLKGYQMAIIPFWYRSDNFMLCFIKDCFISKITFAKGESKLFNNARRF